MAPTDTSSKPVTDSSKPSNNVQSKLQIDSSKPPAIDSCQTLADLSRPPADSSRPSTEPMKPPADSSKPLADASSNKLASRLSAAQNDVLSRAAEKPSCPVPALPLAAPIGAAASKAASTAPIQSGSKKSPTGGLPAKTPSFKSLDSEAVSRIPARSRLSAGDLKELNYAQLDLKVPSRDDLGCSAAAAMQPSPKLLRSPSTISTGSMTSVESQSASSLAYAQIDFSKSADAAASEPISGCARAAGGETSFFIGSDRRGGKSS